MTGGGTGLPQVLPQKVLVQPISQLLKPQQHGAMTSSPSVIAASQQLLQQTAAAAVLASHATAAKTLAVTLTTSALSAGNT